MRNYHEHIKAQSKLYQFIVYGFMVLVVLWLFMNIWGYNYILKYKAKNPLNTIEGCAYYSGKSKSKSKYGWGYYISVNNYVYDTQGILKKSFMSRVTWKDFYKNIDEDQFSCHKIKYVELNLILTKKIFIYDYLPN